MYAIHFHVSIYCVGQYILYENLRQLNLVVLRLDEHILALPVIGLIITTSVLQYILHAICNMPNCDSVKVVDKVLR